MDIGNQTQDASRGIYYDSVESLKLGLVYRKSQDMSLRNISRENGFLTMNSLILSHDIRRDSSIFQNLKPDRNPNPRKYL